MDNRAPGNYFTQLPDTATQNISLGMDNRAPGNYFAALPDTAMYARIYDLKKGERRGTPESIKLD